MNAVNAKAPEPSMDEILASIRRIIADDGDEGAARPAGPARAKPDQPVSSSSADGAPPAAAPATLEFPAPLDLPEIDFADPAPASPPTPAAPAAEPTLEAPVEALVSSEATKAVGIAFDTLSRTILNQNARTLEDLVKEMLRPMLRSWLDDNLPPLVERLVRAEIERVARGHR